MHANLYTGAYYKYGHSCILIFILRFILFTKYEIDTLVPACSVVSKTRRSVWVGSENLDLCATLEGLQLSVLRQVQAAKVSCT